MIEAIRLHGQLSRREARERAIELLRLQGASPEVGSTNTPTSSAAACAAAMIAMAMAADPRLLIADEPTTALDVTTKPRSSTSCASYRPTGMAIMLITTTGE